LARPATNPIARPQVAGIPMYQKYAYWKLEQKMIAAIVSFCQISFGSFEIEPFLKRPRRMAEMENIMRNIG